MNKNLKAALDILWYIVVFFFIQLFFTEAVGVIGMWLGGWAWNAIGDAIVHGSLQMSGKMMVVVSVLSSILTLCLFAKLKWGPVSRNWMKTKPVGVLVWAAIAAVGTIIPSEWIVEQMQYNMPEETEKMFEQIMGEPTGYLAIGILAPLAEELVFRGAILRKLLSVFGENKHWIAIIISAVIFGLVHLNIPQFVHAALIGLLLGWMYYRTKSIIPGVLFHWVNNTVAYAMFNIMPQMADGKLIDLFHGDSKMMFLGILFSLFILVPSVIQLNARMKS